MGLLLSDDECRIAVGLRLGAPITRAHTCRCGTPVAVDGHHGLSCKRSAGRHIRHSLANDIILRAFKSADTPAELEPVGLSRSDGKRPDGATLIPWRHGKCALWDFTCPDSLAPSQLIHSSVAGGYAADAAENRKAAKYHSLIGNHHFYPFAIETFGAWGPSAIKLSGEIGRQISVRTGEVRATSFFRQRLDVAVQRGNAVSVRGTANDIVNSSMMLFD